MRVAGRRKGRPRPCRSALEAIEDAPVAGRAVDRPALADAAVAEVVRTDGAVAAAAEARVDVGHADQRGLGGRAPFVSHLGITGKFYAAEAPAPAPQSLR